MDDNRIRLTEETVATLERLYPEGAAIIKAAPYDCKARGMLPVMMRSYGRREGVPKELDWVFDRPAAAFPPPAGEHQGMPTVFVEMLGELKGIRELLMRREI